MSKLRNIFLSLLVVLAPTAVAQDRRAEEAKPKVETNKEKLDAAATSPGVAVDPNTFQLGAEDIIFVSVWKDPDFTRAHIVRPDGKITLPLVGEVQAAGLTPVQLAKSITEKLTTMMKDPKVDVSVTQVNSKRYYIQGEVNKAGAFPLIVPTTVLEALSNSGGFRDFANKKNIVILRKGQRLKFNYNDVIKGKNMEQNIYLEHGDYIVIP